MGDTGITAATACTVVTRFSVARRVQMKDGINVFFRNANRPARVLSSAQRGNHI